MKILVGVPLELISQDEAETVEAYLADAVRPDATRYPAGLMALIVCAKAWAAEKEEAAS